MVTLGEAVQDEVVSDQSQQRKSPNSGYHESLSIQEENILSAFPKKGVSELQKREDHTRDANQVGTSLSLIAEKLSDDLPQSQGSDGGVHASQSNEGRNCIGPRLLQHYQEGRNPSRISGKASEDGYNWRKYGQKLVKGNEFIRSYYRCTHPNCPAKRQVECSQNGWITDNIYLGKHEHPKPQSNPQKAVNFVLSIRAKRQDESSLEDKSSDEHDPTSRHAEPIETSRLPTIPPTVDAAESEISQSNRTRDVVDQSGNLVSKRQKRDICNVGETPVEKPNGEPRVIVQSMSEFDIVNDGYRWRKYGQKLVKGNSNPRYMYSLLINSDRKSTLEILICIRAPSPASVVVIDYYYFLKDSWLRGLRPGATGALALRSYYRCSNGGCPVKKHVERASHDPKVIITTYEGRHGHDVPSSRTVTPNTVGVPYTNITPLDDESRSGPEANGLSLC